jgi:hypothetical protein
MSISPVPYDSFNHSIVPWSAWSLSNTTQSNQCRASTYRSFHPIFAYSRCVYYIGFVHRDDINDPDASAYYIECTLWSSFLQNDYYPSFRANISINLANYGGATSLNLFVFCSTLSRNSIFITPFSTWTYRPVYFLSGVDPGGTSTPVHFQVGDVGFDDSYPSVPFPDWFGVNSSLWNNCTYALGSKIMSLKSFISFQILSQWLYIRGPRLGSDYWIYCAANRPHNVDCHGSQYHGNHTSGLLLGQGYRD